MKRGPKPHSTPCSVTGCERRKSTRSGLCLMHYKAEKRRERGAKQRVPPGTTCVVQGCGGPHWAIGLCQPHYMQQYHYGVSTAALSALQSPVCAICDQPARGRRRLGLDHCHRTGAARGLLCSNCNHGLGHFRDDPEIIAKAIAYLQRNG